MSVAAADVLVVLDDVVDPCSAAMGVPLGLAQLGLVRDVTVVDGGRDEGGVVSPPGARVMVTLAMTSPCCAFGPRLAAAARDVVASIDGVASVDVVIDHHAVWAPHDMTQEAATSLSARRVRSLQLTRTQPFDWSSGGCERG